MAFELGFNDEPESAFKRTSTDMFDSSQQAQIIERDKEIAKENKAKEAQKSKRRGRNAKLAEALASAAAVFSSRDPGRAAMDLIALKSSEAAQRSRQRHERKSQRIDIESRENLQEASHEFQGAQQQKEFDWKSGENQKHFDNQIVMQTAAFKNETKQNYMDSTYRLNEIYARGTVEERLSLYRTTLQTAYEYAPDADSSDHMAWANCRTKGIDCDSPGTAYMQGRIETEVARKRRIEEEEARSLIAARSANIAQDVTIDPLGVPHAIPPTYAQVQNRVGGMLPPGTQPVGQEPGGGPFTEQSVDLSVRAMDAALEEVRNGNPLAAQQYIQAGANVIAADPDNFSDLLPIDLMEDLVGAGLTWEDIETQELNVSRHDYVVATGRSAADLFLQDMTPDSKDEFRRYLAASDLEDKEIKAAFAHGMRSMHTSKDSPGFIEGVVTGAASIPGAIHDATPDWLKQKKRTPGQ